MRLRTDLTLRQIGDDYVIVDPSQDMIDMSKVYSLNESAAFIWQSFINIEFTEDDAVALLIENYDVDELTARNDIKLLLEEFKKQQLFEQ